VVDHETGPSRAGFVLPGHRSTTSARAAVSVRKQSATTTNSTASMASATFAESGSIATGLPAVTHSTRTFGFAAASRSAANSGSRITRGGRTGGANGVNALRRLK